MRATRHRKGFQQLQASSHWRGVFIPGVGGVGAGFSREQRVERAPEINLPPAQSGATDAEKGLADLANAYAVYQGVKQIPEKLQEYRQKAITARNAVRDRLAKLNSGDASELPGERNLLNRADRFFSHPRVSRFLNDDALGGEEMATSTDGFHSMMSTDLGELDPAGGVDTASLPRQTDFGSLPAEDATSFRTATTQIRAPRATMRAPSSLSDDSRFGNFNVDPNAIQREVRSEPFELPATRPIPSIEALPRINPNAVDFQPAVRGNLGRVLGGKVETMGQEMTTLARAPPALSQGEQMGAQIARGRGITQPEFYRGGGLGEVASERSMYGAIQKRALGRKLVWNKTGSTHLRPNSGGRGNPSDEGFWKWQKAEQGDLTYSEGNGGRFNVEGADTPAPEPEAIPAIADAPAIEPVGEALGEDAGAEGLLGELGEAVEDVGEIGAVLA